MAAIFLEARIGVTALIVLESDGAEWNQRWYSSLIGVLGPAIHSHGLSGKANGAPVLIFVTDALARNGWKALELGCKTMTRALVIEFGDLHVFRKANEFKAEQFLFAPDKHYNSFVFGD